MRYEEMELFICGSDLDTVFFADRLRRTGEGTGPSGIL